jgi:hypothetical protein
MLMKSRNLEISTLTTCVCRSKLETMHAYALNKVYGKQAISKRKTKKGPGRGDPCACIHVSPLCPLCFVCLCMDSSCPDSFGMRERERRTPSIHIITIGCYRSTSVLLVKTAAANCIATASSSYAPAGR